MQLAIHRADQPKLFPLIVLFQNAQAVLCLALRDFGMLCPDSDGLGRASSWACAPKIRAFAWQSANWSNVPVKPCCMELNSAARVLGSDSVALIGCPRGMSFVLPWRSENTPILEEWSANRALTHNRSSVTCAKYLGSPQDSMSVNNAGNRAVLLFCGFSVRLLRSLIH